MTRQPENDVIKVCQELGIGFVPYSPLSSAFRSGFLNQNTKYNASNDNRPSLPRYQPDAIKANWVIVDTLPEFGNPRGLAARPEALDGPRPRHDQAHLRENLWSADFEFTADELRGFTEAVSKITIVGERYTGTQARQTTDSRRAGPQLRGPGRRRGLSSNGLGIPRDPRASVRRAPLHTFLEHTR